jgi:hypothetical protein
MCERWNIQAHSLELNPNLEMFSSDGYGIHIVKGKVYPITGHKTQRGRRGTALLFP